MVDSLEIRVKNRNGKRPFCFVSVHPETLVFEAPELLVKEYFS